jgi:hypothetical protein
MRLHHPEELNTNNPLPIDAMLNQFMIRRLVVHDFVRKVVACREHCCGTSGLPYNHQTKSYPAKRILLFHYLFLHDMSSLHYLPT